MRRLYLHIGSNKTGTTTLQRRLSKSADALAGGGFLYPATGQSPIGAHHLLAAHLSTHVPKAFMPREPFPDILARLSMDLDAGSAAGQHNAILSSELLFVLERNSRDALAALFDLFDEVRVIVYLRRQDRFLTSFYNSQVRTGMTPRSFPEFCRNQRPRYLQNLDAWAGLVGKENLLVRPFVRKYWVNEGFTSDFLSNIDCPLTPGELMKVPKLNQSLSLDAIDVIRAVGARRNVERWDGFVDFVEEQLGAPGEAEQATLMTGELYQFIRDRYEAENSKIGERYLPPAERDALCFEAGYVPRGPVHEAANRDDLAAELVMRWKDRLEQEAKPEPPQRWWSRLLK